MDALFGNGLPIGSFLLGLGDLDADIAGQSQAGFHFDSLDDAGGHRAGSVGAKSHPHFVGPRQAAFEGDLLEWIDLGQLLRHALDGITFAFNADGAQLAIHLCFNGGVETAVACEDLCFCQIGTPIKKLNHKATKTQKIYTFVVIYFSGKFP